MKKKEEDTRNPKHHHTDVNLGLGVIQSIDGDDAVVRFPTGDEMSVGVEFLRRA
jgi:hypothetical protein